MPQGNQQWAAIWQQAPVAHFCPGLPLRTSSNTMSDITIYHNPKCGTSRNTLAMIRNSGAEPQVIEYLKTPPDRATLQALIAATGKPVIDVVRTKEALFTELRLDAPGVTDAQLIDAMLLGMGSHFELWDKTTYDAKEAEAIQAGMTQAFEELVF